METRVAGIDKGHRRDILVAIVVLGSLWGLSEVVLSSGIKASGFPYRPALLTGIGMGLMGIAMGAFRKPWMLLAIAPVTILCKQLVVPILGVSVLCKANSCIAVMLQGLGLAGTVALVGSRLARSRAARIVSGGAAAFLAAGSFYMIGMQVAPCPHLLSFNRPDGLVDFLATRSVVWVAFSALLFPAGYAIGARLGVAIPALRVRSPLLHYGASAAIVAACWAASAVAIAAGL
jgi:hypothetical protein